ncbi:MAG: acetylornithine carbamoyltransferase [Saprospiraceae bacterium]|nr:acetylornithine carbamoyltransferase [Saprospiraceae bacterium]
MNRYIAVADAPDWGALLDRAEYFRKHPHADTGLGKNKTLLQLFYNSSLRTRLSTQIAGQRLGMEVITMDLTQGWALEFTDGAIMNENKAEHIREAAGVMSRYADIIGLRSFASLQDRHADYEDFVIHQFARNTQVPMLNLESAIAHPLQALADSLTIRQFHPGHRPKVVLSWAPHPRALPQAVANSFVQGMQRMDVDLVITHPQGFELNPDIVGKTPVLYDQRNALQEADFVYVKNWSSYQDYGLTAPHLTDWMLDHNKMQLTNKAYFMHCLPVRRNVIVTDEVIDSDRSIVLDQAENRIYAAQAVLAELLMDGHER